MIVEQQLIQKRYYESLLIDQEINNSLEFLAHLFMSERNNEESDLSYIRFSQGEMYFHNKDFEAAIFKWEQVHNDLQQWAIKNMADAYYELGLVPTAIDLYQSVKSESLPLHSEVALNLFSIYNEQEKLDFAADVIKRAVTLNPDYPNVTVVARTFFEKYRDWGSAIELAVNEAIRTERLEWFTILKKYIDEELTKSVPPHYFSTLLEVLYHVDQESFEKLVVSLWNSYEEEELYFSWISEINRLFLKLDLDPSSTWHEVSTKYHQTYFSLINGQYLIKEISDLVPNLLTNWLKLAYASHSLLAATAVLAWNEFFKGSLDVEKAEQILLHAKKDPAQIEQNIELFDEIVAWAKTNELDIDHRLKWAVEKVLDLQTSHLLVVGMAGNGKTSFLNSILGGNIVAAPPSTVVVYRNSEEIQISEITESDTLPVLSLVDFSEMKQEEEVKTQSLVHFEMPNKFLLENQVALLDIPDFDRSNDHPFLQLADGLLFVLTATTLFTERERDLLLKMQEQVQNLPVHFLLRTDSIYHEQEVAKIVEEIRTRIFEYFPKARIFPYSTHNKSSKQAEELSDFIQVALHHKKLMETRNKKLLFYIREALTYLLKRRVEIENEMTEVIQWKEDIVSKLNAAVHQLSDLEKEKVKVIQSSYHTIKEDIRLDLKMAIPKLVRDCSALVKEDSDFRNIHIELNQEMNERIQNYIQHTILPRFTKAIQGWIELSSEEFFLSQDYLDEISEGFDRLYGVERLKLNCDFKVLDDWTRDANRLSNGIQLETMNILNRSTPSQLVVKSAGKLFGTFGTNKTVLANMYQRLIEKEDYGKLAATVTNQFILQFEMFEKGLERDIAMFFTESFSALHETIEEEQQDIQDKKDTLKRLKANPENYLDPITLFQVRLLQNEWMQKEMNMSPSFA